MPGERFTVAGAVSSRYRGRISRRMPPYQKSSYRMGGWNFPILEDSFFVSGTGGSNGERIGVQVPGLYEEEGWHREILAPDGFPPRY